VLGGLGSSGHGHALVIEKIGGRSPTAATTVAVPNSLGPGELLHHYGTPGTLVHFHYTYASI